MRWWQQVLMAAIALVGVERALAQAPLPELTFGEPAGLYQSSIWPPQWASLALDVTLQVYPFRVFDGDVRQAFSRTLLRQLIDPRFQETNVAPGAQLDEFMMPGADFVLRAHFNEAVAGQVHERRRVVVVVGTAVAIVDATANSNAAWVEAFPRLQGFGNTVRVVGGAPEPSVVSPPPPTASTGRAVAGLYMTFTSKFDALLGQVPALFFYLLSADGQVYRAYDISVPGNDPAQFDFAAARQADPSNSGHYIIEGDAITMRIGPTQREIVGARVSSASSLTIQGIGYVRQ